MQIKTIIVGPIETNCYIVFEEDKAIVIDPGGGIENIIKGLGRSKLDKIILTHLHFDHIIASKQLKVNTGAKIYCHRGDLEILDRNLISEDDVDIFLDDADEIILGSSSFRVIHTPGHTPGSICLYDKKNKILFSGDTIFDGSIGATHFRGGDFARIRNSIEKKLLILPGDTLVYPGHSSVFVLENGKNAIKSMISQ